MTALNITVAGVAYPVPSSAADTNWAAQQVKFLQALAAAINTRTPNWQTPTYVNSWQAKGSGFQAPRFYVNEWGQFFFEGAASTGLTGTVLCTLPAGYRPHATLTFRVIASGGFADITIAIDGTVTVDSFSGGNVAIFTSLNGITFNVNA